MTDVLVLLRAGVFTLEVAVASWILATVLGMVFALAGRIENRIFRGFWSLWIVALRGIPQLVLIYVLFFGLSEFNINISPLTAAIIGLGVTEAAFTSEVFRSSFMTIGQGTREAGMSVGLSSAQIFRLIELPILVRFATPPLLNSFVGLLKLATLASAIGVPELIFKSEVLMQRSFEIVNVSLTVMGLYLVFTLPLMRIIGGLEGRLRGPAVAT